MMFYSQQREVPIIKLRMNNTDLEPITDFNFLGLIINKQFMPIYGTIILTK